MLVFPEIRPCGTLACCPHGRRPNPGSHGARRPAPFQCSPACGWFRRSRAGGSRRVAGRPSHPAAPAFSKCPAACPAASGKSGERIEMSSGPCRPQPDRQLPTASTQFACPGGRESIRHVRGSAEIRLAANSPLPHLPFTHREPALIDIADIETSPPMLGVSPTHPSARMPKDPLSSTVQL